MKIIQNLHDLEVIQYRNFEIFNEDRKYWIRKDWEIKVLPLFHRILHNRLTTQSVVYWYLEINQNEHILIWYDIKTFKEVENIRFINKFSIDEDNNEYNELINANTNEVLLSSKMFWNCTLSFAFMQYYQWKLIFQITTQKWKKTIQYWIYDVYKKELISNLYYWFEFCWFYYKARTSKYWKIELLWLNGQMIFSQEDKDKLDKQNIYRFEDMNTIWSFIRFWRYYLWVYEDQETWNSTIDIYDTNDINKQSYYTAIKIFNNQYCFECHTDSKKIIYSLEWKKMFEILHEYDDIWFYETKNYYIEQIKVDWKRSIRFLSKNDLSCVYTCNSLVLKTFKEWSKTIEYLICWDTEWNYTIRDEHLGQHFSFNNVFWYQEWKYFFNNLSSLISYNNWNFLIYLYSLDWKKILINNKNQIIRDNIISYQKNEKDNVLYLLYNDLTTEIFKL